MSDTEERESRKTTSKGIRFTDDELRLATAILQYMRYGSLAELLHEAAIKGLLMLATQLPDAADLPDFAGRELPRQLPELAWQELIHVFDYLARQEALPRSYISSTPQVVYAAAGSAPGAPAPPLRDDAPPQQAEALKVDAETHDYLDTMGSTLLD